MTPNSMMVRIATSILCAVSLCAVASGVEKTTKEREAHVMKLLEDAISRNPKWYDKAMDELRETATNRDVKTLERATRDKRIGIRCAALTVLTFCENYPEDEPPDFPGIYLAALKDPEPMVRSTAARMCYKVVGKSPRLIKALTKALEDKDRGGGFTPVSVNAAGSLEYAGKASRSAYPALIKAMQDEKLETRSAAMGAIGQLAGKDPEYAPLLLGALLQIAKKGPRVKDRIRAVNSVYNAGKTAAPIVPELRELFTCKGIDNYNDREAFIESIIFAYRGIGKGAKQALPDIAPLITDPKAPAELFYAAVQFLMILGEEEAAPFLPKLRTLSEDTTLDRKIRQQFGAALRRLEQSR